MDAVRTFLKEQGATIRIALKEPVAPSLVSRRSSSSSTCPPLPTVIEPVVWKNGCNAMNDHTSGRNDHAAGQQGGGGWPTEDLTREIAHLKTLAIAFERWHEDMIYMTARTRDMNEKGADLATSRDR
jgi:hypothetical protein